MRTCTLLSIAGIAWVISGVWNVTSAVGVAAEGEYKAGVAVKVITPVEPMWMAGYAARNKPAEGKVHDLYAKALCLQDAQGKKLILVTTDLIGIPRPLAEKVTQAIEKKHGIPRSAIMLTSSHTHCGPVLRANLIDMYGLNPQEARKVEVYTDKLSQDLIDLIDSAVQKLEPVQLQFGEGAASFAINRRQPTPKGIVIGVNREGPVDHSVPVLVVRQGDGKPWVIVFGYACHNTTLSFYQWCGDYAGFAQLEVEKAFPGAVAMFWSGCGGDANPHPRGTLELCEKHGQELAEAVRKVVLGKLQTIRGPFSTRYDTITLKIEAVPTREQLNADLLSKNPAVQRRAQRLLQELESRGRISDTYPYYPVQTWMLGDQVHWVALGGEVVVDYALRLKKELPHKPAIWVTGYANDVMAYIPTARLLREGGYEADFSQIYYGMPGKWSAAIEELIITKVKQQAGVTGKLPQAPGPLSPQEELASFRIVEGFQIELVAAEPDVVDPVAMCFDAKGRLYVCEMRGYPNGGVGTGPETRGRIRCLIDTDRDGRFDRSTIYADQLRFPMGITPYRDGVIVAVAPDILFLQDTDGDGVADKKRVLYTGFNLANIQQMVNSLQWGVDHWVYGCAGNDGGTVRSAEKPQSPAVSLRNRGLRFRPDIPASLEPTSGGGQYGLTADDFQHWFTATNSQHLRQIVLPDHYLRRHPHLPVTAVTADIPEHGPAARVFRISPFEPWRVERTARRAGGSDAGRFATTELVPGGYFTSACSPCIYTGDLFPPEFYGDNFVCDPANNLIHRERLVPNGSLFRAVRAYADREFLASTDNWFRPVFLTVGPEGALYVLDFYREVIETPLSLPDDIKQQLNLESRGRGRIWRITPKGYQVSPLPDLTQLTPEQLAQELAHANPWRRMTAQRLFFENPTPHLAPRLRQLLLQTRGRPARVNIAWTLQGWGALRPEDILLLLEDPLAGVREHGLRLAETLLPQHTSLVQACQRLKNDTDPMVRLQLAFTAGYLPPSTAVEVLEHLLTRQDSDSWLVTAALSSSRGLEIPLLQKLIAHPSPPLVLCQRLAALIGARGNSGEIATIISLIAKERRSDTLQHNLLEGLGQGMRQARISLAAWLAQPPQDAQEAVATIKARLEQACRTVGDEQASLPARLAAARLLAYAPLDWSFSALQQALQPSVPSTVQQTALQALASHNDPRVTALLLERYPAFPPATRTLARDILLSRPDRILALLSAIEQRRLPASELSSAQVQQLRTHPTASVRQKAQAVLSLAVNPDRARVVAAYQGALQMRGDAVAGKQVFQKHCASCHRLDGVGHPVGPDLLAVLGNKSGEDLLIAIFDPNREVDPRYRAYQITTADERVLTGILTAETPTSITLRRPDGAEDTLLRAAILSFQATPVSLMPEGLEKELQPQDVANLLAYLRTAGRRDQ
ncbi:MAG: neutral/alkaline non-lysosomal ceramidase N-terminal domain-containing protein [Thermogemmata sp.]